MGGGVGEGGAPRRGGIAGKKRSRRERDGGGGGWEENESELEVGERAREESLFPNVFRSIGDIDVEFIKRSSSVQTSGS